MADALATFKARMGFMANSGRIMARRPKIVFALADLARAIMAEGDVSFGMKSLIGQVASWASGCLYCQAHFANNILRAGIEDDKLDNLWNFERSELFSEKETRDFAFRDGPPRSGPNAVTDADSRS